MTDVTNFGSLLKKETTPGGGVYVVVGEVQKLDFPEVKNPAVESTHQSSGGNREFVSGGLVEVGEFKATLNYVIANVSGIIVDLKAGTIRGYEIDVPASTTVVWRFNGMVTGFKPLAADAQKPETLQGEVTFRPTGNPAIN